MRSHPSIFCSIALSLLLIPSIKTQAAVVSTPQNVLDPHHPADVAKTLTDLGKMAATGNAALSLQLFNRAVKIAQTIEDTSSKIDVLSTIALKLAQSGQTQKSKELFEQVVQLTKRRNKDSLYEQDPALRNVVIKIAQAGFTQRALQLTKTISAKYYQAEALNAIAPILAAKGQVEPAKKILLEALQKARGITGDYAYESNGSCSNYKFEVMSKIATNLSSFAQFERALQLAKSIENCSSASGESTQDYQTWAFLGILANSANLAQVKQTWTTAQTVKDAEVWSKIAVKLVELGETNLALSVASKISNEIPSVTKIDSGSALRNFGLKETALSNIAIKLAEVGQFEPALQVAEKIYELTEEEQKENEYPIGRGRPSTKMLTLVEVSRQLAKAKQIESGLKIANSIGNEEGKAKAIIAIAQELQKMGQGLQAQKFLDQNLRLPEMPQDNDSQANQLIIDIAGALVPAGQVEKALQIAQSFKNYREEALTQISNQLVEIGQVDRALPIAKTLTFPGLKDQAFNAIASKFIELGQVDRALQVAQLLEDDSKTNMLANIADSFAKLKQTQKALQVAETLTNKELKANAIANIAANIPK